jgi:hypothetical protein
MLSIQLLSGTLITILLLLGVVVIVVAVIEKIFIAFLILNTFSLAPYFFVIKKISSDISIS